MKITNRNSLYNAVNKFIRIHNRRIKNRRNFGIYKYKIDDFEYEEEYYKESIEEKKIVNAIIEYLEQYDYADGVNWEKTKIVNEYDEYAENEQSFGIWVDQRCVGYCEDSYYGTITFKIPKNKKYVQFDYNI